MTADQPDLPATRQQAGPWRPRSRRAARPRWHAGRAVPSPAGVTLPNWDALSGAGLQGAWADLVTWVTWLHDRYELSTEERLPHCWAEHPGLIEELSALKAWHDEIYGSPQPSGQAARYWHAELRQTITAALTFYAAGCRVGHHAGVPAAAGLRRRWASAAPPDTHEPGAAVRHDYLPDAAMRGHVAAARAAALSDTITSYLRYDGSWWQAADGGWQRVTDPAAAVLLDGRAEAMARADQAVRQAAALQAGA